MSKAVILLSGGLDSTTCLAIALNEGYTCFGLSMNYQQKHLAELQAAYRIAKHYHIHHHVLTYPTGYFSQSALTDQSLDVPTHQESEAIPVTYVPARNTVFLSMALSYAEQIDADAIFIGVSAIDYSHYPDCRPAYIEAFQTMANLAIKRAIEGRPIVIKAPLLHLTKAQTIQWGHALGVCYDETVSCYRANEQGEACGTCSSCFLRKKGFSDAGVIDPTRYLPLKSSSL